jgi:nucleoside-diphosphate-sugar epimerase
MTTTLVTGGAGYVGVPVVQQLLASGRRVRVLDTLRWGGESLLGVWPHPHFELVKGDVTVAADRAGALDGAGSVVHLAAIVGDPACKQEPDLAQRINLDATRALYDEAAASGAADFIFVSTCSNYGIADPAELATERSPLNPASHYARTKVAAEEYLLQHRGAGPAATVLRLATVYGVAPRMRFDLTVNEFARDAALRKPLEIFAETLWRPYVHVSDVASAVRLVLDSPEAVRRGEVFNVGHTGENYQKLALCRLLQERVPELDISFVRTGADPRSYRVSFEKIASRLGFQPAHTVPAGIDEVIELVRSGVIADLDAARWRNT